MAAEQRARFTGAEGVVFIGVAQEKAHAFRASKRMDGPLVGFQYSRQPVHVNYYYFYLLDADFGPAFIKVCTYAPFTLKVYLNGHEWAKRQLQQGGHRLRGAGQRLPLLRRPGPPPGDLRRAGGGPDPGLLRQVAGARCPCR